MKMFLCAAVAVCLSLPAAVSAKEQSIVVSPKPLQEWVVNTSTKLDRALSRIDVSRADAGFSLVRFTADKTGKPLNVRSIRRGPTDLDRVARIAVRNLRLDPLSGVPENQVYEAAIVLGDTPSQLADLRKRAAEYARDRNEKMAAKGFPNTAISLGAIAVF